MVETSMKQLRQQAGLSQSQLAAMVGVTASTVSKWDQGLSFPRLPPEGMQRLITALQTDLGTLAELDKHWRNSQ